MNSILSTRCPGRRLTNEITHEWSEVKQEEKNTYYHGTQNNIMTFFMFLKFNKSEINLNSTQYPKPPQDGWLVKALNFFITPGLCQKI